MTIPQYFVYTGQIETFIVPDGVLTLDIEAIGASGGDHASPHIPSLKPGYGASIKGQFSVTPEDEINILVGQKGESGAYTGGGGGGSFVWLGEGNVSIDNILIAAGGGGGIGGNFSGFNASLNSSGTNAFDGGIGSTAGNGGIGGIGSPEPLGQGAGAGGGAGISTSGGNGKDGWDTINKYGIGGQAIALGGAGGTSSSLPPNTGGFGGGGGGAALAGGGGGGYSGGDGGAGISGARSGGGGGSFNRAPAITQRNIEGVGVDNGEVIITYGYRTANFTITSLSYLPNFPINFDGSSSTAEPGYTILNYYWDFGDGSSTIGQVVTHAYNNAGTYKVTLTITESSGYIAEASQSITITTLTRGISLFN